MVAHELFNEPTQQPPEGTPASAPTAPPPKKRSRGGLIAGVAALAVLAGTGSGAVTATILGHNASAATATTTPTSSSPSSNSSASSQTATTTAAAVYKQVSPSVVTIQTVVGGRNGRAGQATGSGIVLDSKGNILTNNHVIAGAQQIQVSFSDGSTASATVVGANARADLAVIKVSVSSSKLHPATLGNSDNVQVGDTVYAIGSPFGLSGSFSEGIVSNLHQTGGSQSGSTLSNLIQTDAAINPGNSGGPMVNTLGEVVGVNSSIESPVEGNVGVGFAIPINTVKQMLSSLEGGSGL